MNPLLGYIEPVLRTPEQHQAHAQAVTRMLRFSLPPATVPKGTKVMLTDFWKDPEVVTDVGYEFNGFHQFSGSCVGVSTGNAIFTLGAVQRNLTSGATKAFVPFWPYNYGLCRLEGGQRGQGEGAVTSLMTRVLPGGVLDLSPSGLPEYKRGSDGIEITKQQEFQWSDGSRIPTELHKIADQFPVKSVAILNSTDDIMTSIVNGYPVLNGCEMYCGNGSIKGSGADACVMGQHDARGGHATCFLGYWNNVTFGDLFLYSNQWPTSTYPKDPAGGGRCCVWMTRAAVDRVFSQYGGGDGETMALSHLQYFPAQPGVLDYTQM